jgi:hypothetical protein
MEITEIHSHFCIVASALNHCGCAAFSAVKVWTRELQHVLGRGAGWAVFPPGADALASGLSLIYQRLFMMASPPLIPKIWCVH